MDEIIIYKEGENLKEKFSNLRFSYTRKYKLFFAYTYNQLGFVVNKKNDVLIFYFKESLTVQDRIRIKNLTLNYPTVSVCLCSDKKFALDAWKMDAFYFTEYPVTSDSLVSAYKRYILKFGGSDQELLIKEEGEVLKIPFAKITYLQAAGNYTLINQKGDRQNLQTKQLGSFMDITEKDLNFDRVHRSLIVNMKNVESIGKGEVSFYQCEKKLKISASLQAKLKKLLLSS